MENRKANIIIGSAGGTASKQSKTYKISLPTEWVRELGITDTSRQVQLSFDGEKIIIEKCRSVDEFIQYKVSMGHDIKKFEYYDENTLCSIIAADFSDETLAFENYVDNNIKTAFGKNENPTWTDFENFLADRCVPESRAGIQHYINALGIDEYDPIEIIKKTQGRMAEDSQWLKISEVEHED